MLVRHVTDAIDPHTVFIERSVLPDGVAVALQDSPEGVPAGAFGWNGGGGTSWRMDPADDRTVMLLTGTAFTSPDPPLVHKALWRLAFG